MEHKLATLQKLKTVTLTAEERALLRTRMAFVMRQPVMAEPSLFAKSMHHGLRIALSSFALVVFVSGAVSAVANDALPGDPLYSFKVNVNEEVKGLFLKTPAEKVAWQKNRIETRLSEIKTLAESKTLTKAKQETAEKALNGNIKDLSNSLATLSDHAPSAALSVTASLEQNLKENKAALQNTLSTTDDDKNTGDTTAAEAAIKTVDGTIAKVSEQEVKILSKEVDTISNDINTLDTTTTLTTDVTTSKTPASPNADTPAIVNTDTKSSNSVPPSKPTTPVGP